MFFKSKKNLLILFILSIPIFIYFVVSVFFINKPDPKLTIKYASNIWYVEDPQNEILITSFNKPIEFLYYTADLKEVKDYSKEKNFSLAINGSFYDDENVIKHAGFLYKDGKCKTKFADSKQINGVVDYTKDSIKFLTLEDFKTTYSNICNELKPNLLFQTGPIIIKDNEVQNVAIENSLNGNGQYYRTLLGYDEQGNKFFIITKKIFTLKEISNLILSNDFFKGKKINMINLDGGRSTSMYSKDFENFNFRTDKNLPILIGIN